MGGKETKGGHGDFCFPQREIDRTLRYQDVGLRTDDLVTEYLDFSWLDTLP